MMVDKEVLDSYEINTESKLGKIFGQGQANGKGVNYDKINQFLDFKPLDDKKYSEINCEKEEAFVSRFEKEISVERETSAQERKQLADLKILMQKEIQTLMDQKQKTENDQMDAEYAQQISLEEQKDMDEERNQRKVVEERDSMAFKIISEFPHIEYQHAYQLLQDKNWNLEQVKTELADAQTKNEETVETLMQVLQECPDVVDIDEIRSKLVACNWDATTVINQYKDANKIRLLLCDCSNMSNQYNLDLDKSPNVTGMDIINHLVAVKPLSPSNANNSYNIYRDSNKASCITYVKLSDCITNLELDTQPMAPDNRARMLWFNEDSEMKWE